MKFKIIVITLFIGLLGYAQQSSIEWPREIKAGTNFLVKLYQPQLESLEGNRLNGRLALSIKDNSDEKLIFGALWFEARLATDLESRTAKLEAIEIPKIKFPDIKDEENIERLRTLIVDDINSIDLLMSLDDIIANLESVETESGLSDNLENKSPNILFRQEPTVLVIIDGDPIIKKDDEGKVEYVVNTPFFIAKDKETYYLKGEKTWYKSASIESSEWQAVDDAPKAIQKFADKNFDKSKESDTSDDDRIPKIVVSTKPTELIVTEGDIEYNPIKSTNLLFVDNTENDIILEIDTQTHYVLINGRWYSSKSLKDGEWSFVEPSNLPESFKKIPADAGSIASVRVSIPGTEEAKEAMYEQYIPQTAVVDKKTASTKVTYDGEPKFKKIDDTNMEYAVNTQSTVLKLDSKYYVVDSGVWFESNTAEGPWKVSDSRPEEVKDIPPSSPVYNVKYVYVYDSTPEVVYVGYTPGYYHSYVYGGVVVYGTGYYYTPWYGYYYYPRPVTYGFGVHYNPYTGWGFSVGVSYGWMTLSFHSYGYWGPAGYRHGYRHGYYHGYHHGYHNGYAAGYARGRYDSNNVYRRSNGQARTGISTRRGATVQNRDLSGVRDSRNTSDRNRNNLFADKSGNVFERNRDGNWSEKRNNISRDKNLNRDRTSNLNNRTQRSQLDRQYNNRSRGNTNTRNFNTRSSSRGTKQALPKRRG